MKPCLKSKWWKWCQSGRQGFQPVHLWTLPRLHFLVFHLARCHVLYGSNSLPVWMCADWLQSWVTSRKIKYHCSHLCSVDTNTYTTGKTSILFLSKALCHILCIHVLELGLSLFCITIEDIFQEHCIIRNKGSFSSAFCLSF